MEAGAIASNEAYHAEFPHHITNAEHPICHLAALTAVACSYQNMGATIPQQAGSSVL